MRRLEIPRIEIDNPEMWEFSKKSIEINNTADGGTENQLPDERKTKIVINETVEIFEHAGQIF